MHNVLGIIGGVGPLASAYFYEMITQYTKATKDQDHMDIILLSHASIPDRTAYILGKSTENPYPLLLEDVKLLEKLGVKEIIIPCNTSCYFHKMLQEKTSIPIYNLVEETVQSLAQKGRVKVMILATEGTIETRLYQDACEKYGVSYVVPDSTIQQKVMHIIYNNVKAGREVERDIFEEIITSDEVDAYIMGCTELSVVKRDLKLSDKYIDPLEVATYHVIQNFGKERKEKE